MPHLCIVCDGRFSTKESFYAHKQNHTERNLYSCTECERHMTSQCALYRHMNIHASKFTCTECGKCCHSSNSLAAHRQSHCVKKPHTFECSVCTQQFTRSSHLTVHSRIHSGEKPYVCYVCEKAFSQCGHLQGHMAVHMADKHHKCSVCNRRFSRAADLRLHIRCVHDNRRPYQCHCCGRRFKINRELKQHALTHTGTKPYSCGHCSDQFTRLIELKRHLLKSHSEGTWLMYEICQNISLRADELLVTMNNGGTDRSRNCQLWVNDRCLAWRQPSNRLVLLFTIAISLSLIHINLDLKALMMRASMPSTVRWSSKFHLLITLLEKNTWQYPWCTAS